MTEVLFTLLVVAAVLALVTDTYTEVVLTAALLAAIWRLAELLGPSLTLGILIVAVAALIRMGALLAGMEPGDTPVLATFLDELLTRHDRPDGDQGDDRRHQQGTARLDTDTDTIDDYRR